MIRYTLESILECQFDPESAGREESQERLPFLSWSMNMSVEDYLN